MDLIKSKIKQAQQLLDEQSVDMWIVFVRETSMQADPVMPMLVGIDVTWQSFFLYTRHHGAIALVGNFDEEGFKRSKRFDRVIPYTQGVKQDFLKVLNEADPSTIALNFSMDDPSADGLTHGMYLQLRDYLTGTTYANRLTSAADLCSTLRARKLPREIALIENAARISDGIWQEVVKKLKPGLSEIQIGKMIDELIEEAGGTQSFPTIVNAGSKTEAGHATPTEAKIERGEVLHVDFGAKIDGYCADIQRLAYFKRRGESGPPASVEKAFNVIRDIVTETGARIRPGLRGLEIDQIARDRLVESGYEEYQHALGHQLGRDVHDGGALIGPAWERYGRTPSIPLELNNVFTLELEIILPGVGCIGLEEDVVIKGKGVRYLSPRQTELVVV